MCSDWINMADESILDLDDEELLAFLDEEELRRIIKEGWLLEVESK